jgi:predicted peptidase
VWRSRPSTPGVGHNSWDRAYDDPELWKWMLAQKRK